MGAAARSKRYAVATNASGARYTRFRSTMRLENVVERYAPLTAAYQPKLTTAPPATTTNARTPGRSRSARGTASIASSAIAGSTPIPIANAPPAQLPYSSILPFQPVVTFSHSPDR